MSCGIWLLLKVLLYSDLALLVVFRLFFGAVQCVLVAILLILGCVCGDCCW